MTGILPIAKYSSGSEINMFKEYDMSTKTKFSEYSGFLDDEVDRLFDIYLKSTGNARITRDGLALWYDGYYTAAGDKLYNPRSVVCALTDNQISSYWTGSGPYDEIFYYIRNNIGDVREDLVLMVAGEGVEAEIQNYAASSYCTLIPNFSYYKKQNISATRLKYDGLIQEYCIPQNSSYMIILESNSSSYLRYMSRYLLLPKRSICYNNDLDSLEKIEKQWKEFDYLILYDSSEEISQWIRQKFQTEDKVINLSKYR